ncbi:MAG: hypothetical protein H6Q66_795 [Firmicutes bacterium]|nr:hypothetical protein [Bacillota bacterium]
MQEIKVKVEDMKTPENADAIKEHLLTMEGVTDVTIDIEDNMVSIKSTCSPDDLVCSIKTLGFFNVNTTSL